MYTPRFSIITVCYNAAHTIGRTVESVAAQTCTDYEHLIIDGKSIDNTLQVVDLCPGGERRIIISEPDSGIYDAMNKGLGKARGEYLIFLNAGDKFHDANTLERINEAAAESPGIIFGETIIVNDAGEYVGPRHLKAPRMLDYKDFAQGMVVCHQAFVVLRHIAPLYDTYYRFSADYDWCIKCLQHSRQNVRIDGTLIDYLSEGVTTSNRKLSLEERYHIMCHYYGTFPTILRHIGFALRYLRNRLGGHPS